MFAQSPVCVPSRSNFITGRYPHCHGVRENDSRIGFGEPHLFRVLKKAGYKLAAVGKNHMLDEKNLGGFNYEKLDTCEVKSDDPEEWKSRLNQIVNRMNNLGCWAGAEWHDFPEELTGTKRTANAALDFLKPENVEEPFCLWVSFEDPHAPHTAPSRFKELYPLENIPLSPPEERVVNGKHPRLSFKKMIQGCNAPPEEGLKKYKAVYGSMVSFIDEQVGHILNKIDELGLRENTIIIYTADHGDFLTDYGMTKKDLVLYDVLLNIPCLVSWGNNFQNGKITPLAEQIDLYPTILDACNIDFPKGIQGKSMVPLLKGETDSHRDSVHAEICYPDMINTFTDPVKFIDEWKKAQKINGHPLQWTAVFNLPGDYNKAVRTEKFKYIWYINDFEELYDLKKDPKELNNVANDANYQDILISLREELGNWHMKSEDPLTPKQKIQIEEEYPF